MQKTFFFLLLGWILLSGYGFARPGTKIYTVDTQTVIGPNTHFWKAIGHDFLFQLVNESVGKELLDRMEHYGSCVYFRTHYTFSNTHKTDTLAGGSVCGQVLVIDENGNRHYDFSKVNRTFREYVKRGMKPIVEFDFFPDRMARGFGSGENDEGFSGKHGEPKDWAAWEELLNRFMQNLMDTFGREEMRTWYFEVWNEPDEWNRDHIDVFFRMYDVFASVVKSCDPLFRVGGPACYHVYFLRDFLGHVVRGRNFVTGQKGSPLDFISYHLYGLSGSWLTGEPGIVPEVQRFTVELLWIERLLDEFGVRDVEFHLNEWGQCSHYYRSSRDYPDLVYRDNERAALFMVKLVDHLYKLGDSRGFRTDLSGYWGFCGEAKSKELFIGNRDLTTSGNVPKPILTAYEMLAQLGEHRLDVQGPKAGGRTGLFAAKSGSGEIQILVYNYNETDEVLTGTDSVRISLKNVTGGKIRVSESFLDRNHHNTYRLWERLGSPKSLTPGLREKLLEESRLKVDAENVIQVRERMAELALAMPRHSMRLIRIETDR